MAIGTVSGARGTMTPNNFQNRIPIWPPRLRKIIEMGITPSVFVIETYISTLGPSVYPEGIWGPGPQSISKKKNPIWPPRLHEIIKMAITPSAFVIETYIWTLYLESKYMSVAGDLLYRCPHF